MLNRKKVYTTNKQNNKRWIERAATATKRSRACIRFVLLLLPFFVLSFLLYTFYIYIFILLYVKTVNSFSVSHTSGQLPLKFHLCTARLFSARERTDSNTPKKNKEYKRIDSHEKEKKKTKGKPNTRMYCIKIV